jgi:hypothetical protein
VDTQSAGNLVSATEEGRRCSERQAGETPISVENWSEVVRDHLEGGADRAKRVVSVHNDLAQRHRDRGARHPEPSVGGAAKALAQLWHRAFSETTGRLVKCPVRRPAAQSIEEHRGLGRLGKMDEVANDVSNPPPGAPGRAVRREVGERL